MKLRDQAQGLLEKAINERSKSLEEDLRQVEQQRKEYKEAEQRIAREKEVCIKTHSCQGDDAHACAGDAKEGRRPSSAFAD